MKQQWGDIDKYTPVAVKTKYHLTKMGHRGCIEGHFYKGRAIRGSHSALKLLR